MSNIYIVLLKNNNIIYCLDEKHKNILVNIGILSNKDYRKLSINEIQTNNCTYESSENIVKNIRSLFFNNLKNIYLDTREREKLSINIKKGLIKVNKMNLGTQCIMKKGDNKLSDYLKVGKLIGSGDWGNVFKGCLPVKNKECIKKSYKFAIKMSRLEKYSLKNMYSSSSPEWHEVLILRDIISPIILKNICPNLPLLIDSFVCDNCSFVFNNKYSEHPCIIIITELATGNMKDFFQNKNPTEDELYSSLFQIMAAIHSIQIHGQIMNNDVKVDNILYYNVVPGGYWHYIIHGIDFYVPNYGKLFVLNDFGVSQVFSPIYSYNIHEKSKTFLLGSRYGIVMNGKFSPINSMIEYISGYSSIQSSQKISWVSKNKKIYSSGSQYNMYIKNKTPIDSGTTLTSEQTKYLNKNNIESNPMKVGYFENPLFIPPFEFYNDTQDAIRMFTGGIRTTQHGYHTKFKVIGDKLHNKLIKYHGIGKSSDDRIFSTNVSQLLAGRFITDFFTKEKNYTKKIYNYGTEISLYKII